MRAVPRQEYIHAIGCSHTYVQSVKSSLLGQRHGRKQRFCQSFRFIRRCEDRQVSKKHPPLRGGGRVTGCTLGNDDF